MNRRDFLTAGAGMAALAAGPDIAYAAAARAMALAAGAGPDWSLAVGDIAADVPTRPMSLVEGRAPVGFGGALYRNGPGLFRRPARDAEHWFDGDGLIRAFRIDDGRASVAARFVDTPKRRADSAARAVITPGFGTTAGAGAKVGDNDDTNAANISVLPVNGELWALWEAGSPTVLDRSTLATKGVRALRPDLAHTPFLAHPRIEPGGRIWNLGLNGKHALVWRLAADGALEAATLIELPRASYIHDFTATDRHLVIVLQPWIMDSFQLPYVDSLTWRPELGTQVLVLDKDDLSRRRIHDLPPFFFFHLGDAWEDASGAIRFDACIDPDPDFATRGGRDILRGVWDASRARPRAALITLGADGRASLERAGHVAEFPRADPRFAGRARRYTVSTGVAKADGPLFQGVVRQDWQTGRADTFDFGSHQIAEEMVFTPRPGGTAEMDGWLVGTTLNLRRRATELHVFDARQVAAGPLATWRSDIGFPVGFHGAFVPA